MKYISLIIASSIIMLSNLSTDSIEKDISISVKGISFDCNTYKSNNSDKILVPHEIFISLSIKNNGADSFYIGAQNSFYPIYPQKYGYFQAVYFNDTVDLHADFRCSEIIPNSNIDVSLRFYDKRILKFFSIISSTKNLDNITSILKNCKLIYIPMPKTYGKYIRKKQHFHKPYDIYFKNYDIDYLSSSHSYLYFYVSE